MLCSAPTDVILAQWKQVMLFLMGNAGMCVLVALLLNYSDSRLVGSFICYPHDSSTNPLISQHGVLNYQTKRKAPDTLNPELNRELHSNDTQAGESDPLIN